MIVREVMTANPETLEADSTVGEALMKFIEGDYRHLPVTKNGQLIGIISERDLRGHMLPIDQAKLFPAQAKAHLETNLEDIVQDDVMAVTPDMPIKEVIDLMAEQKMGAFPVMDPEADELVGIVSYIDILRAAREILRLNAITAIS